MKLTIENKRSLVRAIFAQPAIDRSAKFALLDKVLGNDKSDKAVLTRIFCKAALPDADEKKQAWKEFTDISSKMQVKQLEEIMYAFFQNGQDKLTRSFTEKDYFEQAYQVFKHKPYKVFKTFFKVMMPRRNEVTPELIQKMKDLTKYSDKTDSDLPFVKLVNEGVDLMNRQVRIRELAKNSKSTFFQHSLTQETDETLAESKENDIDEN